VPHLLASAAGIVIVACHFPGITAVQTNARLKGTSGPIFTIREVPYWLLGLF
jgi:hypothetical protein